MNVVEHKLRERFMDPDMYSVSWDDEVATFLLFNLSGQIVGYQNYRWYAAKTRNNDPRESKYFTYQKKFTHAVWGMESFDYRDDVLFLVEGIFDAVRLHNLGLPCVATLSNDPKALHPWLKVLSRPCVSVCDGDTAGIKLAKLGDYAMYMPDETDLGDMETSDIKLMFSKWL